MPEVEPVFQRYILDLSDGESKFRRLKRHVKDVGDEGDAGFRKAGRGARSLDRSLNPITRTLTRIKLAVAGALAAFSFGAVFRGLVGLNGSLEQTKIAFETMLGPAGDADKLLRELFEFTETTPFQFDQVAEAGKLLLAFGSSANEVQGELRAIGDISAGIGAPLREIAEIYGKARVQGRLFQEDINQLTGRGIPIIQELAKQFGVAESEVRKLTEQGRIGFPAIQRAFSDLTSEGGKFAGLMERQSQSLFGIFSTLKDIGIATLRDVGRGLFEGLKSSVVSLRDRVNELREDGSLELWAKQAGAAITGLFNGFIKLIGFIVQVGPKIVRAAVVVGGLVVAVKSYRAALLATQFVMNTYRASIALLAVTKRGLATSTNLATGALVRFKAALARTGIGLLAVALGELAYRFFLTKTGILETTDAIKEQRRELDKLLILIRRSSGIELFQRSKQARSQVEDLEAEIRERQRQLDALDEARVIKRQPFPFTGVQEFSGANFDEKRRAAKRSSPSNDPFSERRVEVIVTTEGEESVLSLSKAIEEQQTLTREINDLFALRTKAAQTALEAEIKGSKDLAFQLEVQREKLAELTSAVTDADLISPDQKEAIDAVKLKIKELTEDLRKLNEIEENTQETTTPGTKAEANARKRAKERAAEVRLELDRAAQLVAANEEIRDSLKDLHAVEDQIRDLRDEAKAAGVVGTPAADALNSSADLLEEERTALTRRLAQFEEFRTLLDRAAEGINDAASDIGKAVALEGFDIRAFEAAVEAVVADLEEELTRDTIEIEAALRVEGIPDDERDRLEGDLEDLQANMRNSLSRVLDVILSSVPGVAVDVVDEVNSILEQIRIAPDAERAIQRQLTTILDGFDRERIRLEIDLEAGKINEDSFQAGIQELLERTRNRIKEMWDTLPAELRTNLDLLDQILGVFNALSQGSDDLTNRLDSLAQKLDATAQILGALGAFVGVFGGIGEGIGQAIGDLGALIQQIDRVRAGMQALKAARAAQKAGEAVGAAAGIGGIVGVAVPALGALTAGVSLIRSLAGVFGGKSDAEREEQRRAEEALTQALRDNADKIASAIDRLIRSERVAPDTTGDQRQGARAALDDYTLAFLTLQEAIRQNPTSNFAGQAEQANRAAFIEAIKALDLPGLDGIDLDLIPFEELLDFVRNLVGGLGTFGKSVDGAAARMRFLEEFLGLELPDALRDFVTFLLDGIADLPPDLREMLEGLQDVDPTTQKGRDAINGVITAIATAVKEGSFDFGGLTSEDIDKLLDVLKDSRDRGEAGGDGIETSQSVSFVRTITEFQGQELVLLAHSQDRRLEQLVDAANTIIGLLGGEVARGKGEAVGVTALPFVPEKAQATAVSFNGDPIRRAAADLPASTNVINNTTTTGGPLNLNVDIHTEQSISRMKTAFEAELRKLLRGGSKGRGLFGP